MFPINARSRSLSANYTHPPGFLRPWLTYARVEMGRMLSWSSTERSTSIALFLNDRFFGQFQVNRNHRAYYGSMVLFFLIKSKFIFQLTRMSVKIFECLQIKFLKRTKRNFRLQLSSGGGKLCLLCNSYIFRLNEF